MRLALFLALAICSAHAAIPLTAILGYGVKTVVLVHKALEVSEDFISSEIPLPLIGKRERNLKNSISAVSRQIDNLHREEGIIAGKTLNVLQKRLPADIAFRLKLNDLRDYLKRIDVYYNRMKQYTEQRNSSRARIRRFEQYTLENFAMEATAHNPNSVLSLIERVHDYFMPERHGLLSNDLVSPLVHLGELIHACFAFAFLPCLVFQQKVF